MREILRRYIEHFFRYSASVNYKNITFTMMAVGGVDLFSRNFNKLAESVLNLHLSQLFALERSITDLCLNTTVFNSSPMVAREIVRAFNFGYRQVITAKSQAYKPQFAQEVTAYNCTDFMSAEDLAAIDNIIRILSYGRILKLFIYDIPPLMPQATDLDTAILRSLMVGQKEDAYFPEIIAGIIKRLNLTESAFEEGLKKAGVWFPCPLTHEAILFPVTTNAGKSYDMTSLSMLQAIDRDPITREPLTDIYYNKTLFNIIYHGIRDVLNKHAVPEKEIKAFMAQWMEINESLQKNLRQKQLVGTQPEKEEASLFAIVLPIITVCTYTGRLVLPMFIPFACQKELGGWQNPLPQWCADFEAALQLQTKGFQGAFDYGVKSASECLKGYTPKKCNSNEMKSACLNNPFGRGRDSQVVSVEEAGDSFIFMMLSTFIGPLLLLVLTQMTLLGAKLLRGNWERAQDVSDALNLLEQSQQPSIGEAAVEGYTLQQLKSQYQKIQSQPNAERDKLTTLLLCTGCSYSHFATDKHEPCVAGAELITDYDTSQLLTESRDPNQKTPKPP